MKKVLLLICLSLAMHTRSGAQTLRIPAPEWRITAERYHLVAVVDNRKNRESIGEVVSGSRRTAIRIDGSLEQLLFEHLSGGLLQKTSSTAGLRVFVDRFQVKDVYNSGKHTITLDSKLRMVRDMEGVSQTLFESESKPTIHFIGPQSDESYVRLVIKAAEDFIHAFDTWARNHPEQPWFMNHVIVRFAPRSNPFKGDDTLLWQPERKLAWSDFRGKAPQPSSYSAQSNCVYALATLQGFSSDTMILTSVLSPCFTRKASWVETGSEQEQLLQHEQLHFDLCELYARRFRKKLAETPLSILQFDREIQTQFGQFWEDYRSAQVLYDEQTQHGTLYERQAEWDNRVQQELQQLSDYATH